MGGGVWVYELTGELGGGTAGVAGVSVMVVVLEG